ncbi:MAG: CBS domain-containing protein [Cyanobacteriota bacterium]
MTVTVADVMTPDPLVVHPETPLNEAIKLIAERRVSGLPVVDADGKLVGVLSEADLMWRETGPTPPPYIMILDSVIYLENPGKHERELHKALGQTVGEVMTGKKEIVTTTPNQTLQSAAKLMHDRDTTRLPVLDESGKVIGILTRGDIVRHLAVE